MASDVRDSMKRGSARRDLGGQVMTWLCGGALAFNLLLILGLLVLLAVNGLGYFWQATLWEFHLADGSRILGEIREVETIPTAPGEAPAGSRLRLSVGNRDLTGADFRWVDESEIVSRTRPGDVVALERLEWGPFYGHMVELRDGDEVLASGVEEVEQAFPALHAEKRAQWARMQELEEGPIADANHVLEELRLEEQALALEDLTEQERARRLSRIEEAKAREQADYERAAARLATLRTESESEKVVLETLSGKRKAIPVGAVVRAVHPNRMGVLDKARVYASRLWEFVSGQPRESNTEGGIFPAIFGTVLMVFLMSFVVAPFGVLAAVYLREYAKEGPVVRLVRIAVNNLAGVPSIVFGVFGLGFFVYLVGGTIDQLFYPEALPTPTYGTGGILWASLTLALLTVPVVIVATEEGLAAVPSNVREGSLALGATKYETLRRVVLPAAAPGMLTGVILAMARAAGEVAPLMIVGMVKLAPTLPVDDRFPFLHLERKFMHLGFHIYDVGFQSPNVEAVKPLVFATALLLIVVVVATNLVAIVLRNHLRSRYSTRSI